MSCSVRFKSAAGVVPSPAAFARSSPVFTSIYVPPTGPWPIPLNFVRFARYLSLKARRPGHTEQDAMQAAHGALPTNPLGAFQTARIPPGNHLHAAISGIRAPDQMATLLLA